MRNLSKFIICVVLLSLYAGPSCRESGNKAIQPNILLILIDDQGYADYGGYIHSFPDIRTPNMKQLADDGIRFTQAYATSPICSPSRSGLITGRYQQRWGNTNYARKGLPDDGICLPLLLKEAGYRTVKIGKTHYGEVWDSKQTDEEIIEHPEFPLNHGFEEFFGFMNSTHDYARLSHKDAEDYGWDNARAGTIGPLLRNTNRESHEGYSTDVFTEEAIHQINRSVELREPFYIHLSYNALHVPIRQAPAEYLERYGLEPYPFWDPDEETFREWHERVCWPVDWDSPELRKYYLAALENLDDNLGKLLVTLAESGVRDNTLVIFTSDNGGTHNTGSRNAPLSGHKYLLREGGIRVPFVISWPHKLNSGVVNEGVISAMDLLPTCMAAATGGVPDSIPTDGINLLPFLEEDRAIPDRNLFWWRGAEWAVRKENLKLHVVNRPQWLHGKREPPPVGTYLFDLEQDTPEQFNLADETPEKVKELYLLYRTWREDIGQPENVQDTLPGFNFPL
jgi:arylsulfatase A-like enzyme